jgi:hypothetical protein
MSEEGRRIELRQWFRPAQAAAVLGSVFCLVALFFSRAQTVQAYWAAWVFWSGVSFGFLALLMIHALAGGAWGEAIRRFNEAGAMTTPFMGLLLVPALFDLGDIFPWARDPHLFGNDALHQRAYFQAGGFILRGLASFAILGGWTALLGLWNRRASCPGEVHRPAAAAGLVLYVFLMLFASTDWVVSLEPRWTSTMFVIVFAIDHILAALSLAIVLFCSIGKPLSSIPPTKPAHDLGNLLLAFVMIWAYVTFSQFLIIWSGNLPREISWYLHRNVGPWPGVTIALALLQFAVPFGLLLFRAAKQKRPMLGRIAILVFGANVLHTWWLIAPSFAADGARFVLMDLAAFLAIGGVWGTLFLAFLQRRPHLASIPEEVRHA